MIGISLPVPYTQKRACCHYKAAEEIHEESKPPVLLRPYIPVHTLKQDVRQRKLIHTSCNPYNGDSDNAEAILPAPPRTPDYSLSDDDLAKPNLESDEESPPASQLEKRHKTELTAEATQWTKRRNPSRQSPPKVTYLRQTSKRKGDEITSAIEFKRRKTEESILKLKIH